MLAAIPEQEEAKRLLRSALGEEPAHAYLFHGPRGVGKRRTAVAFAAELLGEQARVERGTHPDLYVLEPVGDQIRIDEIRRLRRDLRLRPFEAERRVYLVLGADLMNEDAADALLKDLEEAPDYAVIVLVADQLEPLPATIRSRCQHVPFRLLSRRAVLEYLAAHGPELSPQALEQVARVAAGRLDRAERLLDPEQAGRRRALVALSRSTYRDERFDAGATVSVIVDYARAAADEAQERVSARAEAAAEPPPTKELEQEARRAARGAEREAVLDALDLLAGWYRDLLAVEVCAEGAVLNSDFLAELREDAGLVGTVAARAAEIVLETRLTFELNVTPGLALEALFVRLRQLRR